ncbi:MAG: DUF1566 domain-containing protein [Ferruginibacter sp.]|nr:DUF1566 domain-containing protein [Ferruginibacter sp.]
MKKYFLLFTALFLVSISPAQNVGIGTTTPAASAQLDVTSTNKGFLPPRMSSTDRNAIASPSAGLTIYNTTINAVQVYNGTNWYSTVHYIGERYGGGIVYYVYDNGQHGLIAADGDVGEFQWNYGTLINTLATGGSAHACLNCVPGLGGGGIGGGARNTTLIIASQSPGGNSSAAMVCTGYAVNNGQITYEDWYLPSIDELHLLYLQKTVVGGFANDAYWSSSEAGTTLAWWQTFFDGLQSRATKSNIYRVRPVRAF